MQSEAAVLWNLNFLLSLGLSTCVESRRARITQQLQLSMSAILFTAVSAWMYVNNKNYLKRKIAKLLNMVTYTVAL